jgi:hypothetical protein
MSPFTTTSAHDIGRGPAPQLAEETGLPGFYLIPSPLPTGPAGKAITTHGVVIEGPTAHCHRPWGPASIPFHLTYEFRVNSAFRDSTFKTRGRRR